MDAAPAELVWYPRCPRCGDGLLRDENTCPTCTPYTHHQVERLFGLATGVSIVDIISWARDPGGDNVWRLRMSGDPDPRAAWTHRRGPLDPRERLACVLYDWGRAFMRASLLERAVVSMWVMGMEPEDIAAVINPDEVLEDRHPRTNEPRPTGYDRRAERMGRVRPSRELDRRRKRIVRMLQGRAKRDAEGKAVRDENGDIVHLGGLVAKFVRWMNTPPVAPDKKKSKDGDDDQEPDP